MYQLKTKLIHKLQVIISLKIFSTQITKPIDLIKISVVYLKLFFVCSTSTPPMRVRKNAI